MMMMMMMMLDKKVTEAISKEASIGVAMLGEVDHHQQLEKVFHQRKMKSDLAERKLYKVCPTYV